MTSNIEKTLKSIDAALAELDFEIGKAATEKLAPVHILERFRENLIKMKSDVESEILPPKIERKKSMSRVIVDSWPLESKLGEIIVKAETLYYSLDA